MRPDLLAIGPIAAALAALLAACAAAPGEGGRATLAQDSVTSAPETAACLARAAAVEPAAESATTEAVQGKSVLGVDQAGADARIEVAPAPAGSHVTYEGPGSTPPKSIQRLVQRCTVAP
jgi:hypothetical protein